MPGRARACRARFKEVGDARIQALRSLRMAMASNPLALKALGLSGPAFQKAVAINRAFDRSAIASVLDRIDGRFVDALDPNNLTPAMHRALEDQVLFLCPLLGLLSPSDRVPDYRCRAGARLPGISSLHFHWKPVITRTLNRALRHALVLSFLPTRLAALWVPDAAPRTIVTIRFSRLEMRGARGETAAAPGLTGEMLRFVVENRPSTIAELVHFESSAGHTYSAAHSDGNENGVRLLNFVR